MKSIKMKIKIDVTKLRNEFHFDVQRKTRAHTFKAKKGKGSFQRHDKHKQNYIDEA